MSTVEPKALARRFIDEVWNGGKMEVADDLFAASYINHSAPLEESRGPAGVKQRAANLRAAYPDIHVTADGLIAEGDRVVVRFTARGTHKGEAATMLGRIAPTGKQIVMTGTLIYRVFDGKIVECWANSDQLAVLQQFGAIPAPAEARR